MRIEPSYFTLLFFAFLPGCGADTTKVQKNLESQIGSQDVQRGVAEKASGPLHYEDISAWCHVESKRRAAIGPKGAYESQREMMEAQSKACAERGITSLQHQVVNARITVALMHLDQGIPAPEEKRAEVDLVARHRAAIDAARGR